LFPWRLRQIWRRHCQNTGNWSNVIRLSQVQLCVA
jgi:hypothetical protein